MGKIVYLLEYIPKNILMHLDSEIVALTPMVMYELDRRDIKYKVPSDYVYPRVVEPVSNEISVFNQILSDTRRAEDYWCRLLECFQNREVCYYGTEFKVLDRILKRSSYMKDAEEGTTDEG